MTKLIAIRVKDENARKLYELAQREHRNPGQQLDVILEALADETERPQAEKATDRG